MKPSRFKPQKFLSSLSRPPRAPIFASLGLTLLLLLARPLVVWAAPPFTPVELDKALQPLVQNGGVIVGGNGAVLYEYQPGHYKPASIIKLATSLAALHYLGPDYHFHTDVYRDGDTLYLRGYGDPFLVSEEWSAMALELAQRGLFDTPLGALVLDTQALSPELDVDGLSDSLNPYDAPLGALVANFNTIYVQVHKGGRVESAEPQTPLTPIARKLALTLRPGTHRINLAAKGIVGVDYTAELAREIFQQAGAKFTQSPRTGIVPAGLKPVLVYRNSRPLSEILRQLLEFSNNFTANQIVLAIALEKKGEPAHLADGISLILEHLRERLSLATEDLILVEGSGLSLKNQVSLKTMLRITDAFYPWRQLLKMHGHPPYEVPAKTGSMTHIYTLAGFLPAPEGERRPFVIMLNQRRHVREEILHVLMDTFSLPEPPMADSQAAGP
ncbi:MAG: D-alanyl-D-alanine carboxypeptidase, partial [Deltaproteobacteria bacterium]|nr:D-alanyl-D-alanine carboxypeptidase [Deltaproteobacteria bacterium]